ncbi:hypothetical protein TNIN_450481 [Trichonephila inaurata madagascariensis]|uniref:Uncharacterized protein n=1 Tax=Trichonephila inaurata madagascariensis TaxID=2747483 RepID=A0A8X7CJJ2_9ARAC|nr:hypothetical protein TNIN_450481 [Trichonephila inaurata madagascariensis]
MTSAYFHPSPSHRAFYLLFSQFLSLLLLPRFSVAEIFIGSRDIIWDLENGGMGFGVSRSFFCECEGSVSAAEKYGERAPIKDAFVKGLV